ncbi:MAG: hypothetical protein KF809_08310 [Chloroflexi bacterium]|nr:hypothetical protein [Chloroflexota bacterium]
MVVQDARGDHDRGPGSHVVISIDGDTDKASRFLEDEVHIPTGDLPFHRVLGQWMPPESKTVDRADARRAVTIVQPCDQCGDRRFVAGLAVRETEGRPVPYIGGPVGREPAEQVQCLLLMVGKRQGSSDRPTHVHTAMSTQGQDACPCAVRHLVSVGCRVTQADDRGFQDIRILIVQQADKTLTDFSDVLLIDRADLAQHRGGQRARLGLSEQRAGDPHGVIGVGADQTRESLERTLM